MEIRYFRHYSHHLDREMEFKVYGHKGKPVMFIPCQGGRFFDFENFGMIDHWASFIEAGQCMVFSIDSLDGLSYAAFGADNRWRMENHERWHRYVTEELVPYIKHLSGERNGFDQGILPFGCSMGAMHAATFFFRRPDLFDSLFAISGLYDSGMFFDTYMDDLLYNNTPVAFLSNMPQDHPYMEKYNHSKILIVVGQGAWEDELLASTRMLDTICCQKGIHARFEYWGYDVNHDWPWWFKMVEHYVPQLLG